MVTCFDENWPTPPSFIALHSETNRRITMPFGTLTAAMISGRNLVSFYSVTPETRKSTAGVDQ